MLHGKSIQNNAEMYFNTAEYGEVAIIDIANDAKVQGIPFTYDMQNTTVTGESIAIWGRDYNFLFFVVTDQEWNNEEFDNWLNSISLTVSERETVFSLVQPAKAPVPIEMTPEGISSLVSCVQL